jgi:hypothetical protein
MELNIDDWVIDEVFTAVKDNNSSGIKDSVVIRLMNKQDGHLIEMTKDKKWIIDHFFWDV